MQFFQHPYFVFPAISITMKQRRARFTPRWWRTGDPASPPALGPTPVRDGVFFRVWAPRAATVAVRQVSADGRTVELMPAGEGYFSGLVPNMAAGALYTYLLDGTLERSDPASRCQPQGVHGPSLVVDPSSHRWQDADWHGMSLADFITYELHVGAFSPEGTFSGVEPPSTSDHPFSPKKESWRPWWKRPVDTYRISGKKEGGSFESTPQQTMKPSLP